MNDAKRSAGLMMYRRDLKIEVCLVHHDQEGPLEVAKCEFEEQTGFAPESLYGAWRYEALAQGTP